jgi:CBS domain-containing protein
MSPSIEQILQGVRIEEIDVREVCRVEPTTPLAEVYRLLDERHLGAVVVCERSRVVGIFTERDVLYRTALEAIDPQTPIRDLMTATPRTLSPNQRVAEAIAAMVEGGFRQIPVVADGGSLVGLLTSRAILRFIAEYFPGAVLNLPPRLHQTLSQPGGG